RPSGSRPRRRLQPLPRWPRCRTARRAARSAGSRRCSRPRRRSGRSCRRALRSPRPPGRRSRPPSRPSRRRCRGRSCRRSRQARGRRGGARVPATSACAAATVPRARGRCAAAHGYARAVATDEQATLAAERDWWLRTVLVLQAPRSVFVQLRDESDEALDARQEPVTAIVFLAGIAAVLATTVAGRLLDDPALDALTVAVWAIVGGGFYGIAGYFAIGVLVLLGVSLAGS